jgi:hypothetical protein
MIWFLGRCNFCCSVSLISWFPNHVRIRRFQWTSSWMKTSCAKFNMMWFVTLCWFNFPHWVSLFLAWYGYCCGFLGLIMTWGFSALPWFGDRSSCINFVRSRFTQSCTDPCVYLWILRQWSNVCTFSFCSDSMPHCWCGKFNTLCSYATYTHRDYRVYKHPDMS